MPKGKYIKDIPRNWDGIEFEELRRKVDPLFNQLHDELSDCYYNYWRYGKSKPFVVKGKVFDVQETPEKSKELFDKLHGLIFHLHKLKLYQENEKLGNKKNMELHKRMTERIERIISRKKIGENKYIVEVKRDKNEIEKSQEFIQKLKQEGIELEI